MAGEPQTIQLDDGAATTLDGAGGGAVRIGPTRAGQVWRVTSVGFQVSSNTAEPEARVYLGTAGPANFQGGSYSGSNDSAQCDVTLYRGQFLTCVWILGDPGATATLSIYGEMTVS